MEKVNMSVGNLVANSSNLNRMIQYSKGAATEGKKRPPHHSLILSDVINWIKDQKFDEFVENELIKEVKSYPHGSLSNFPKTVKYKVAEINKRERDRRASALKIKKELDIDSLKEEDRLKVLQDKITIAQMNANQEEVKEEVKEEPSPPPQTKIEKKEPSPAIELPTRSEEEIANSLNARRLLAQRLKEMSEADQEWMQ